MQRRPLPEPLNRFTTWVPSQAGLAQPLIGMGQQQQGIGTGINQLGQQLAGRSQIPFQTGDGPAQCTGRSPSSTTNDEGWARADCRSPGLPHRWARVWPDKPLPRASWALTRCQYGQQRRAEAMGDINQYASMLGQAGQLKGLGGQTIGAGAQTLGLGGQQLAGAGALYGQGAQTAATAGGLAGAAQTAQEQYGMDTAQMAQIYGGLQGQQAQNLLGGIAQAGQQFAKRPFGLGGHQYGPDRARTSRCLQLISTGELCHDDRDRLQGSPNAGPAEPAPDKQQSAGMTSAAIGVGTTAATTGANIAAMSCWVAAAVYGEGSRKLAHIPSLALK